MDIFDLHFVGGIFLCIWFSFLIYSLIIGAWNREIVEKAFSRHDNLMNTVFKERLEDMAHVKREVSVLSSSMQAMLSELKELGEMVKELGEWKDGDSCSKVPKIYED